MQRLARGDLVAFEMFYDAYHLLVFGIGLRLLGDGATAEDLTQGVFLKIWMSPAAYRGGSLIAWIARVARNASLDILRQRPAQRDGDIPADVPLDGALEEEVFASLDAQRVRSALRWLPANERIPIEMGFFDGKTYSVVAAEIGVPLGTVKTRIRTGLHRLRDALADQS